MKFAKFQRARCNNRIAVNPFLVISIRELERGETIIGTRDNEDWRVAAGFDEVLAALRDALRDVDEETPT